MKETSAREIIESYCNDDLNDLSAAPIAMLIESVVKASMIAAYQNCVIAIDEKASYWIDTLEYQARVKNALDRMMTRDQ